MIAAKEHRERLALLASLADVPVVFFCPEYRERIAHNEKIDGPSADFTYRQSTPSPFAPGGRMR
jgi:hypothetical protein